MMIPDGVVTKEVKGGLKGGRKWAMIKFGIGRAGGQNPDYVLAELSGSV
jgi:hypothetical protein